MRLYAALLFAPFLLSAQPERVGPLETRPARAESAGSRKPASFGRRLPAAAAFRLGALRQEEKDAVARRPELNLRGFERKVNARAPQRGQWQTLDDGRTVWRLALQADGAMGLRVYFSRFQAGAGEVWVYSQDGSQAFGPYSGSGIDGSGEFWSNTIFGDALVVEYQPAEPLTADGSTPGVPFLIPQVSQMVVEEQPLAAGSCELDVSCYSNWSSAASGVGMYLFQSGGATYACSGALVNNTANDSTPYFLTANHCVADAAGAASVEVFWNDQSASCNGGGPNLANLPRTLGAAYLASAPISAGDFSLLRLNPLPNINLNFFGWNSSASAVPMGASLTGIHHPAADYTRVSFGSRVSDAAAQVGSDLAPSSLYYQVLESAGKVEPGSSGSPLLTADKMIVGTLTYGPSTNACSTSPFVAGYARFSAAYPSLSKWLSPAGGSNNSGGGTAAPPAITLSQSSFPVSWTIGAPAPAAASVQVSTTSATPLPLTLKAGPSWLRLSSTSLSVSAGKPATFTFTVSTTAFTTAGTNSGTILISGAGISQSVTVAVTVGAPVSAVKGGPASFIPLVQDGAGAITSFTLMNPYSSATLVSMAFASPNGAPLPMPLAGSASPVSWQNVTIQPFGTFVLATTGTSNPQKQGMAIVQSGDPAKRVQVYAQINQDVVSPADLLTLPVAVPFDATTAASTTLYLYNPAATGSIALALTLYDQAGMTVGTGQVAIPAGQQAVVSMSRTAAVFGGNKGTLYITGSGDILAAALRTAPDGRIGMVAPW